LSGSPVLFANSFPKSGTHLLIQILQGLSELGPVVDSGLPAILTFDGKTGEQRELETILEDLRRLKNGDIAYGHLHARPEIKEELTREGVATYFIYRDPRDIVVSHVHYITEMAPNHAHHKHYKEDLHSFHERLKVSILGLPEKPEPFPNINHRFEPYAGWLDAPGVLSLKFEEYIQKPAEFLEKILECAISHGFNLSTSRQRGIKVLRDAVDPQKSPTYRSGRIGRWREAFTEEHKAIFKEVAGNLLIRLGYEQDKDW
jgi:hypothetical protein